MDPSKVALDHHPPIIMGPSTRILSVLMRRETRKPVGGSSFYRYPEVTFHLQGAAVGQTVIEGGLTVGGGGSGLQPLEILQFGVSRYATSCVAVLFLGH